mgnify:CR=1 FL=1
MECTVSATSAMMDMSMLTGSGVSVNIFADDMDTLQKAAKDTAELFSRIEGVSEVSDGLEDTAPALHVAIDRNEAMKHGLTVAQVYMELAAGLTADGNVASLELDGISTDVIIEKPAGAVLDAQQMRDYVFEVKDKEGELDAAVEQGGVNFSGGQRQRLTIARALVRRPRILILDDSASALDYATDANLRMSIRKMPDPPTIFIVSQRAASVRYADEILVLDDGELVGKGTHDALLKTCAVYQEIYYSQFPGEVKANG